MTLWGTLRAVGRRRLLVAPLIVALCVLASAAVVAPFYYSNPPNSQPGEIRYAHDLTIHLAVIEQFDKMLRSGTIYPRWLPDVNYGYGNAWPNFYPPGFYYLTSLVNAIANNWINTLFVITSLGLAASGLAFYILARAFFGKAPSAIAALLYALLPYHLIDFFWRGAMPEFLSFVLLPLILFFVHKVGSRGGARFYAGLGLCYGLSLMLHTPIAYLFSYVLVLYGLAWAVAERDWRVARRIFLGMAIGVVLSAIYWLPAMIEIKYAAETVTQLFQYHEYYITQLPGDGAYENLLRATLAIQSAALVLVIAAWGVLTRRGFGHSRTSTLGESVSKSPHAGIWAALGMLAVFMNLPTSYSIARMIPRIEIVAFPSRWLAFVCLFTALLTGAVAELLINVHGRERTKRLTYSLAASAAVIAVVSSIWFAAQSVIIGSRSNPMVTTYTDFLCDTYCPKGTGRAADLPLTERIEIEPETAHVELIRWEPLYREAVITTDEIAIARFKTFNFPGWTAQVDGKHVTISSDSAQAQVVSVPSGSHTVQIVFGGTLPRTAGAILSLVGALVTCGLAVAGPLRLGSQRPASIADTQRFPSTETWQSDDLRDQA
ncbi:MAG TPA: 6-pyruvoyl-tetrahydropterin synthase-related protein [Blastocatellia bacterium]|nr:6-pyruvoyl-tetrahydropterin synthase-related protein [Blastocatellia bacterium]